MRHPSNDLVEQIDLNAIRIQAKKVVVHNRRSMRPLQDRIDYRCTGPDGKQYQNYNLAELKALLRQRYGKVAFVVEFEDHR